MDNTAIQKFKDIFEKNDSLVVIVGRNHTLDEMAAALSLSLALSSDNRNVSVVSPIEPLVEVSSLVGIDKVKTVLENEGGDLVVSFPYKDNEIQKVSYTIEDGFLNIVVKAGEQGLTFTEKDIRYRRGGSTPKILIIVGTPRLADLGNLFDPQALKDTIVVNIDNKSQNQRFGDIVLVNQRYSSVSEAIAYLISVLGLQMDVDIAQNLLSGIAFATNNFQEQNTSFTAFEIAAQLMKKGANRFQSKAVNVSQPPTLISEEDNQFFSPFDMTKRQDQAQKDNRQPQTQSLEQRSRDKDKSGGTTKTPPPDWLMPKVYRGSTTI